MNQPSSTGLADSLNLFEDSSPLLHLDFSDCGRAEAVVFFENIFSNSVQNRTETPVDFR